jgi:hypothetical protein
VDSVKVISGDSVFLLNKTTQYCPTCTTGCWQLTIYHSAYLKNQSQFFLANYRKSGSKSMFNDNDENFILKIDTNLNASWVFDTVNSISAQIVSVGIMNVFGNLDSIKTIGLSNADTIIISKNYGIIQFPILDSINQNATLIGIEGLNQGILNPKYENIFNFNVNDVFEYKYINDFIGGMSQHYGSIRFRRYSIIDKVVNGDSIIYKVDFKEKLMILMGDISYLSGIDTLVYVKNSGSFLEKYASQQFVINDSHSQFTDKTMKIGYNSLFESSTKYYLKDQLRSCSFDTLYDGSVPPTYSYTKKEEYGEYRGLIESSINTQDFGSQSSSSSSIKLLACTIGNITYGTFMDDSIYHTGSKEDSNSVFNIYPNPANDQITIENSQNIGDCNLTIFSIDGRKMVDQKLESKKTTLNISNWKNGVYYLKITSDNSVETRKIIKY